MQFWAQIKFLLPRQKRASGTFDIFSLRIFHYFLYRSHQNRNFDNTLPLHYIHFQKYPSTDQQPCRRLTQTVILPPFCPLSVTLSFVSSSFSLFILFILVLYVFCVQSQPFLRVLSSIRLSCVWHVRCLRCFASLVNGGWCVLAGNRTSQTSKIIFDSND